MKYLFLIISLFLNLSYAATLHNIDIKKFKFTPAEISIEVGDTIRWTNKEKRQYHSVWFEQSGEPEPDYLFPDDFFEKTFTESGDLPYRCGPHPKMIGMVHVVKSGDSTQKTAVQTYTVKSIEDGDTLVIDYKGKSQRVQLIGIDAPEDTQNPKLNIDSKRKGIDKADLLKIGKLATDQLKTLVKAGDKVSLKGNLKQKDKYDRLPAIVINEKGESLNEMMIKTGFALLLTRFPLDDKLQQGLKKAENQAKTEQLGLWNTHSELIKKWSN